MQIGRMVAAFIGAWIVAYILAVGFYTQQTLAQHASIGAFYTVAQQAQTLGQNLIGLQVYGVVIAIALAIGFAVAAGVKRVLKPLAPIAYPVAGAAAMFVMIVLVEQQLGGGAGVLGGARGVVGVSLQMLAGLVGGLVFSFARAR